MWLNRVMKKIIFTIITLILFLVPLSTAKAQTEGTEPHVESVDVVLQEILDRQNVSNLKDLNISKISDDEFEELGDAIMETRHPGEAHEIMDEMMGGEGSESLRQMHINMGKAFFGYYETNYNENDYGMGMGMMGRTWDNSFNRYPNQNMMAAPSMMGYGFGLLNSLTWIALITFLAAGTYFFIKQANKKQ